jgi:hypothetical protein
MSRSGWPWFGAWALPGALCSLAVVTAASIGLAVLPLALLVFWLLPQGGLSSVERLAAMTAGAGAPCFLVAGLSAGAEAPDARPWLAAGLVLVAIGIGAYVFAGRRPEPPSAFADRR